MSGFYEFIRENHLLAMIENAEEKRCPTLNLSRCEINKIPTQLLKLDNLNKLYLDNNAITDLPDGISKWNHLRVLTLDYNSLTCFPLAVTNVKNLISLNLGYNNLVRLPPEIGLLQHLEVLWLNHTKLESLPSEIGNCIYLDTLGARGNFIKTLPPEIGNLQKLRWLTLEGNLLSNLPVEIKNMCQLVHLNLSNNQFEFMPLLDDLKKLQYVFLSHNFIKEIEQAKIEKLSFVKMIDLTDNPISDTSAFAHKKYLRFREYNTMSSEEDDSDSEDWELSAPSSELDMSETSEDEMLLDDPLAAALPRVARFTGTGF